MNASQKPTADQQALYIAQNFTWEQIAQLKEISETPLTRYITRRAIAIKREREK